MAEFELLLQRNLPILSDTCVQIGDYVYPVTENPKDNTVAIANDGFAIRWNPPVSEEQKQLYSSANVVDLSSDSVKDMRDHIAAIDKLKNMETSRLSTINNVTNLPINEGDTKELQLVKDAINSKGIDADSYKPKFPSESDFNNDMRGLKSPNVTNISFFKAKRILSAFDADMYLTIKDKPNAQNPIGREIYAKLTEDDE
jgi:hypothetical protein